MERLALLIASQREVAREGVYIAPCEEASLASFKLGSGLRERGARRVELDVMGGRLKQQLKRADRAGARWLLIVGEQEFKAGNVLLKDLESGAQRELQHDAEVIFQALSSQ